MAIQIPIITEFQDQGLKSAKGAFENFKSQVGAAEGAMGKFKTGTTAALDIVKANAGVFALGAGAALGAFATKAVTAFQDLALNAGEFAAKTGLVVDDASRWIEVAGDIGVNIDAVEGAIGRMNKTIGSDPNLVRKLGDDIAYTNEGGINVNETFLNVIQRLKDIKDPTERAKEGAKLFGKGWMQVATLIEMGSEDIKKRLSEVADAKVINQDELKRARDFRDALENLKDKGEELALSLGQSLIPALTTIVNLIIEIKSFTKSAFAGVESGFESVDETIKQVFVDLGLVDNSWINGIKKWEKDLLTTHDSFHTNVIRPINDTEIALEDVQTQFDEMVADIKGDMSMHDLERQMGKVKEAAIQAFGGTREDFLNYQDEVDRTKLKIIEMSDQLSLVDQQKIQLYLDKGDLDAAWRLIQNIAGATGRVLPGGDTLRSGLTGTRAAGGPVGTGTYLVGERGPELLTLGAGASGYVTPNSAIGGGANITVNVQGADPNAVVRALQQYVRQSGPVPVNTRTM